MERLDSSGNVRSRWGSPIAVGAGVGLLTGFLGLFVTELLFSTYAGGFAGAIGCGVAVAYCSEERLRTVVYEALVADVVSSFAVFGLVYVAYVLVVWVADGFAPIAAIWFSLLYLAFGGLVAVPIAVVSLVITGVSAAASVVGVARSR